MSDEEIIRECQKGSHHAQMELYKKYSPALRGVCYRYLKDMDDIEDLVQDSFIKIFANLDKYNFKGSFEGWMKRVTINTTISYLRKRKLLPKADMTDAIGVEDENEEINENGSGDPVEDLLSGLPLTQEDILNAIKSLPEDYGVVFNMYVFEDFKHKEIAEMLHFKVSTSKSKLLRARKMVQAELLKMKKK